jgi:hypothetical protein
MEEEEDNAEGRTQVYYSLIANTDQILNFLLFKTEKMNILSVFKFFFVHIIPLSLELHCFT